MRIHLEGNKYIISDNYSMEIYSVTEYTNKKGEKAERRIRLTGYCTDFESLFKSYKKNHILSSEIEGEFEDLIKLCKKIDRKIDKFTKIAHLALEDEKEE